MIYVLRLVLDGNSCREGFAASYEHLYAGFYDSVSFCIYMTRYSIYINITCIFVILHTMYF